MALGTGCWRPQTLQAVHSAVFDMTNRHKDHYVHNLDTIFRLVATPAPRPESTAVGGETPSQQQQIRVGEGYRTVKSPSGAVRRHFEVALARQADTSILFHFKGAHSSRCNTDVCGMMQVASLPWHEKFRGLHKAMFRLNSDLKVRGR